MVSYELLTIIVVITALFAYLNFRFIKLPATIGIMILSLALSAVIIFFGHLFPSFAALVKKGVGAIDFEVLLLNIMLSFLLFAGAIHINASKLKENRLPIILLATVGIFISTTIIGSLVYFLFDAFHYHVDFIYCLIFGSLISPTDPIAVLGILRKAKIPESLELKISGESLFNDGVGIVIFLSLISIARTGVENINYGEISWLFVKEAGGGLGFGLLLGYAGFYLLRSIDHYQTEVIITLAMVMGGYLLASVIHVSAPIAIVTAGIITGNKGKELAMSITTRDYLGKFWEIIDELLNAILFLLLGFEMLVVETESKILIMGCIIILVVLMARLVSVYIPLSILKLFTKFEKNTVPILTWGALRGGISVAMALSLPAEMYRNEFVTITYIVVIFSIVVQGLTIEKMAKRLNRPVPFFKRENNLVEEQEAAK